MKSQDNSTRSAALKKLIKVASGMMGDKMAGKYPDSVSIRIEKKEDEDEDEMPKDGQARKDFIKKSLGMG